MKKLLLFLCLLLFASCSFAPDLNVGNIPKENPTESAEENLPAPTLPEDVPSPIEESGGDFFASSAPSVSEIDKLISEMTTEEKIGQLIIARVPEDYENYIEKYHIGGFVLFGEDVDSTEQLQSLTSEMQSKSKIPLFISTDEEGGRVSRIGKLYGNDIGPMFEIGAAEDTSQAYNAAVTIGSRLKELGINMDFAPVADIWSNPDNTVIGDRSFGSDAETVAQMVAAAVRGFKDAGVMSVIKHFPGHGDTSQDSHEQTAEYTHGKERFDSFEALPFLSGIEAGTDGVMVGHIATPEINAGSLPAVGGLPATFSEYWMRDVLRDEMGYDGLIITDGLEMGALVNNYTPEEIALNAFTAGADVLLIPPDVDIAFKTLTEAYKNGTVTEERLNASVRRILRAKLGESPLDYLLAYYSGKERITDWEAVVLGLNGKPADAYFARTEEDVRAVGGEYGLATDYARIAVAYRSHGKDPSNVAGYNFIDKIVNHNSLQNQGVNAYIWALIALYGQDSDTTAPFIEDILRFQTADGGFSFTADPDENIRGDIDLTAMAVTALAPYTDVEVAVEFLKSSVLDAEYSESVAQSVVALYSSGEEIETALVEKLESFLLPNNFYTHSLEDPEADGISSYQAALALTALRRADAGGMDDSVQFNSGNEVYFSVLTDGETIVDGKAVVLNNGDSVADILETVLKSERLQYEISGGGTSAYVKGINNVYEFDRGPESGWIYTVNGDVPQKSAGAYTPKSGDVIVWRYVTRHAEF